MNPGSHGYAGGAIYLSKRENGACRKYNNGCGNAEILIMCKVQLGRVLEVDKKYGERQRSPLEGLRLR